MAPHHPTTPTSTRPPRWPLAFLGLLAGIALAAALTVQAQPTWSEGAPTGCRALPPFVAALGYGPEAQIGTADTRLIGLTLTSPLHPERGSYQHPSWDDAGYLGHIVIDKRGAIFTFPAPHSSLEVNPPTLQNRVYRVDPQSGAMALFVDLPVAQLPGAAGASPFGVLGLAYDCDTDSLYIASVAGSTRGAEVGRIFQVSAASGALVSQVEGFDGFGLAVYNSSEKRLYVGSARYPELHSIALDGKGRLVEGTWQQELSLVRPTDRVRRLSFGPGELTVRAIGFTYNLAARSEREEAVYTVRYDPADDRWVQQGDPRIERS